MRQLHHQHATPLRQSGVTWPRCCDDKQESKNDIIKSCRVLGSLMADDTSVNPVMYSVLWRLQSCQDRLLHHFFHVTLRKREKGTEDVAGLEQRNSKAAAPSGHARAAAWSFMVWQRLVALIAASGTRRLARRRVAGGGPHERHPVAALTSTDGQSRRRGPGKEGQKVMMSRQGNTEAPEAGL